MISRLLRCTAEGENSSSRRKSEATLEASDESLSASLPNATSTWPCNSCSSLSSLSAHASSASLPLFPPMPDQTLKSQAFHSTSCAKGRPDTLLKHTRKHTHTHTACRCGGSAQRQRQCVGDGGGSKKCLHRVAQTCWYLATLQRHRPHLTYQIEYYIHHQYTHQ